MAFENASAAGSDIVRPALQGAHDRARAACDDYLYLPAHPMKGIAKAILSRVTNVEAGRYEGTAFARFLVDDAIWTRRKALELCGGRRLLNLHSCKENNENDDGRFHISPVA